MTILPELGPMLQYRNRELGVQVQWQIAFVSFETVEEAKNCFALEDNVLGPRGEESQIRIDFADAEVPVSRGRRHEENVNGEGSSGNGVHEDDVE